jgi:hypothetical protein
MEGAAKDEMDEPQATMSNMRGTKQLEKKFIPMKWVWMKTHFTMRRCR